MGQRIKISEVQAKDIVASGNVEAFRKIIPFEVNPDNAARYLSYLKKNPDKYNGAAFHLNRVGAIGGSSTIHTVNYYLQANGKEGFSSRFGSPQNLFLRSQLSVIGSSNIDPKWSRQGHIFEKGNLEMFADKYSATRRQDIEERLNAFTSEKYQWMSIEVDGVFEMPTEDGPILVLVDAKCLEKPPASVPYSHILQLNAYSLAAHEAGIVLDDVRLSYMDYGNADVIVHSVAQSENLQRLIVDSNNYFYDNFISQGVYPEKIITPKNTIDLTNELKGKAKELASKMQVARQYKDIAENMEIEAKTGLAEIFKDNIHGHSVPLDFNKKDVLGTSLVDVRGTVDLDSDAIEVYLDDMGFDTSSMKVLIPHIADSQYEKLRDVLYSAGVHPADFLSTQKEIDPSKLDDLVKILSVEGVNPHDYLKSKICLLYTSPSPRDQRGSRMPSSA